MRDGVYGRRMWLVASAAALAVLGCSAEPTNERHEGRRPGHVSSPIVGGHPVEPGSWPTVGWLDNGCTGLLVAPDLVAFAAHCGAHATEFWLGDAFQVIVDDDAGTARVSEGSAGERFEVTECTVHPDGSLGSGTDIAWCRLASRALEPAQIVPPLLRCEPDQLGPGDGVTLVGFGRTSPDGSVGVKHEVQAQVVRVGAELQIGSEARGTCAGDSGSPAFVQHGSAAAPPWRVAGLLSSGIANDGCGVGYYTDLRRVVDWLESTSGSDLTSCRDAAELVPSGGGCAMGGHRTRAPLAALLLAFCWGVRRRAGSRARRRFTGKRWRKP